jgi:hypothetical protein
VFIQASIGNTLSSKSLSSLFLFSRYLQKDKISGPEGNTLVYELAERALDGPVNERVKEYISQVLYRCELDGLVFFSFTFYDDTVFLS